MKLRLLSAVCACLVNVAQAASVSSATFDWTTFTITADGADVTSSIFWGEQADFIDTRYIEGATSGATVETIHDIDPNTGWTMSQLMNDGEIATDAITSVAPDLVSAATEVNYTGRAESSVIRFGVFTVSADATFSFSVDYSLSAEVNMTNSETGGGANSLVANPFVDLDIRNLTTGQFGFLFEGSVGVSNEFGTDSNSGTLTVSQSNDDGPLFAFKAGDQILIGVTATSLSKSYSSMPPALVPVPPAIALFISGLGALMAFGRRTRSAVV
ncbi:MAG: hypothetical protein ABFS24_00830 [Pseudomonadota bacterium]